MLDVKGVEFRVAVYGHRGDHCIVVSIDIPFNSISYSILQDKRASALVKSKRGIKRISSDCFPHLYKP